MMAARHEYTEEQQQWRRWQEEEDIQKKAFFDQVHQYPNLFTLIGCFQKASRRRLEEVLRKQETELSCGFEYHLQTVRCENLIVFLLYMLDRKREAFGRCEKLLEKNGKSYITLTNFAVLLWELNRKTEGKKTLEKLFGLYECPDYEYLLTVARAEEAHALVCCGPQSFREALDKYHEVIKECPEGSNVDLWKYDFGLAIRRNFNIFVHSEHPLFSAAGLAEEAAALFQDVSTGCPNKVYKARSLIELASLISHLKSFMNCCREEDRKVIEKFCSLDHMPIVEKALALLEGKDDFYVLRESGRLYRYAGDEVTAIKHLKKALSIRNDGIVNQQLAKTYLKCTQKKSKAAQFSEEEDVGAGSSESSDQRPATERLWSCPENVMTSGQQGLSHSVSFDSNNEAFYKGASEVDFDWCAGQFQCEQSEISSLEAVRLASEFDKSVIDYRYDYSEFKSTDTDCWGHTSCPKRPAASSTEEDMAAHLEKEFNDSVLVDDDGNYKPSETDRVGNIRKHSTETARTKPAFRATNSFPLDHSARKRSHRKPGFHTTTKTSALQCLLRCSYDFYRYKETDPLVQKAEGYFNHALEVDPCNKALIYDVGRMYQGMNKPEKALSFFEQIICGDLKPSPLELVNAYEQSGLCLLKLSERPGISLESEKSYRDRAEDMFMSSLTECRRAVSHMPLISTNRGVLWSSYSEMLGILQKSAGQMGALKKEARVHELVGKYLEALKIYQDVLELANTHADRQSAILGVVRNNFNMGNIREARFILDLMLSCDVRHDILSGDNDSSRELRQLAVEVYVTAATKALKNGAVRDACLCFQSALLLHGVVKKISGDDEMLCFNGSGEGQMEAQFDVCIFDEADWSSPYTDRVARVSSSLMKILQTVFGMRVSLNESGVAANRLGFLGELELTEAAAIVVLVLPAGEGLSLRMKFITDIALQSQTRVLPVVVGDSPSQAPSPLQYLQNFSDTVELELLCDVDASFKDHCDVILKLFQSIISCRF